MALEIKRILTNTSEPVIEPAPKPKESQLEKRKDTMMIKTSLFWIDRRIHSSLLVESPCFVSVEYKMPSILLSCQPISIRAVDFNYLDCHGNFVAKLFEILNLTFFYNLQEESIYRRNFPRNFYGSKIILE